MPHPRVAGCLCSSSRCDSVAAAKGGAARTSGCRLAGGATRIRSVSGTERPRAVMSSPAPLPKEICRSAERGELQKVVKWLRKGGPVDVLYSDTGEDGQTATYTDGQTITYTLLNTAACYGQLAMVRELLKRGASVDLQNSVGITALMLAAIHGHLSILLVLLQHSADPDLQDSAGYSALMLAAYGGHEACVQALLRAAASSPSFSSCCSTRPTPTCRTPTAAPP